MEVCLYSNASGTKAHTQSVRYMLCAGMDNVDALVTAWGLENFDYAIMHFDDSSAEWSR